MMKYPSLAMALILLSNSNLARTQSAISDNKEALTSGCPVIRIVKDAGPWDWKAPIRFEVQVEGADPEAKLRYTWVNLSGRILSGQGTNSIVAAVHGQKNFSTTVVVCGLPAECQNVTSISLIRPLKEKGSEEQDH